MPLQLPAPRFHLYLTPPRWQALIQSERQAHYHSRARQLLKEISFLLDRVELLLADGSLQRHQHQNEASKATTNNECPKSPRAVAQVQAAQRHSTMRARQNRLRERKQELEEERAFCHRCHARHPAHPVAFTRRTGRTTSHNAACRCVPAAPSLAQPGLVVCKRASRLRAAPRPRYCCLACTCLFFIQHLGSSLSLCLSSLLEQAMVIDRSVSITVLRQLQHFHREMCKELFDEMDADGSGATCIPTEAPAS